MTTQTTHPASGVERLGARAWGMLLVLCGALFLDALDVSMVGVALPSIRDRPRHVDELAAVGRERVRARLRRLPAARRPRRRPARTSARVPDRARRVRRRVGARRPRRRRHATDRDPLHQGRQRRVHRAGRPLDHHHDASPRARRATRRSRSTPRPARPASRSGSWSAGC